MTRRDFDIQDGPELSVVYTHGGRRANAGRKLPKGKRPAVRHRTRPSHAWIHPAHVTIPFLKTVGSLRRQRVFIRLRAILHNPRVEGFQVVHYSVQNDHLHLIVEAVNRESFSSGMRSLCIRVALSINKLLGRSKGRVLRDRYHRRDLFSGNQVRRVLVYVLLNGAKHKVVPFGELDPYSSSSLFDGWRDVTTTQTSRSQTSTGPPKIRSRSPWTHLLASRWRGYGLISPEESIRWAPSFGPDP